MSPFLDYRSSGKDNKARIKFKDKAQALAGGMTHYPCIRLPRSSMNNSGARSCASGFKSSDTLMDEYEAD